MERNSDCAGAVAVASSIRIKCSCSIHLIYRLRWLTAPDRVCAPRVVSNLSSHLAEDLSGIVIDMAGPLFIKMVLEDDEWTKLVRA